MELAGRVAQIEGAGDSAALTLAFTVILEAQQCGEPVAWITPRLTTTDPAHGFLDASVFYPPDAHETGIDLSALPVVRVPGVTAVFAAADVLLRSGGFGLIVADLGSPRGIASTSLARLTGLARRHHTALLFLTRSPATRPQSRGRASSLRTCPSDETHGSLGALISLHVHARRRRVGQDQFQCGLIVLKDKQCGPVWQYTELHRGAMGLC